MVGNVKAALIAGITGIIGVTIGVVGTNYTQLQSDRLDKWKQVTAGMLDTQTNVALRELQVKMSYLVVYENDNESLTNVVNGFVPSTEFGGQVAQTIRVFRDCVTDGECGSQRASLCRIAGQYLKMVEAYQRVHPPVGDVGKQLYQSEIDELNGVQRISCDAS